VNIYPLSRVPCYCVYGDNCAVPSALERRKPTFKNPCRGLPDSLPRRVTILFIAPDLYRQNLYSEIGNVLIESRASLGGGPNEFGNIVQRFV